MTILFDVEEHQGNLIEQSADTLIEQPVAYNGLTTLNLWALALL